jgi:hypothetical protein
MENPIPANNVQNFFNAHAAAQLATLQQFSNKLSEDKFTANNGFPKLLTTKMVLNPMMPKLSHA